MILQTDLYFYSANLTREEIELFKNWVPISVPDEEEKFLTLEGEHEFLSLGQNFRKYFDDIVPKSYDNATVKVCTRIC